MYERPVRGMSDTEKKIADTKGQFLQAVSQASASPTPSGETVALSLPPNGSPCWVTTSDRFH